MAENKNSLISGSIGKALLAFVLPLMAGSLIQQLYVTADAVIVGQFAGKIGLAAIDSVHTLFKFPLNFMNGLSAGTTILISGYFGAGQRHELNCSIRTSLTVAMGLGVVLSVAGFLLSPWLLSIMSVPAEIYELTLAYTRLYFSGIWAMILYNMTAGIMRSFGDSKRPMYVLVLCSVLNIAGDFLLVGAFGMGVQGAALATIFAQVVSVVCNFVILSHEAQDKTPLYRPHYCREHIESMVRTGFPLAMQAMLFPIANSIVQASVNTMGTDAIAAWGICDKLDMLIWLIADSMSPAMTTYAAQNLGADQFERVKRGTWIGAGMSAGAVGIVSLVLFFASGMIGPWFVSAKDAALLMPLVVKYMQQMAPFFFFYALAEAFSGACCGMGDTVGPMITTLVTICLLRVAAIFLILPHFRTMECIVWIYIASWIAAGTAFTAMFCVKMGFIQQR